MQPSLFATDNSQFDLPDAELHYTDNFIAEQALIYQQLLAQLEWRQDTIKMYGRRVKIPRLNAWYGDVDAHYGYSGLALQPRPWQPLLLALKQQLEDFTGEQFNSVLANYYRDGNDSVAWHSDDEKELGVNPVIASLSFGASRQFSLRHKSLKQFAPIHIDLAGGSLLLMAGTTQRYWQHQVAKTSGQVGARINLTFRRIV
ncbi:alpha-ketoglutarate-dependent dioxygenase AlkB [Oceanicoccus sp. KOV_DT_Chl]|uniref:alpha-ketoglutarate-dependent dioxygenase AlkB family protein n=1 Tax=Oceanicoccus sp. KOV_DT_Chl TaxID=1904639 RepID=UPI000C7CEA79|nr:alpha-ketoglutarate-dependent dioxygenase AlkB [Oceanicoccus sp. KOV_DT_Chl]